MYSEIPDEKPFWWESTLMKGHLFWNLSLRVSMEMKSSPRTTPLSATFVRLLGLSLKIGSTVQWWNYWKSSYQFCFSACKDKGIIFTHILISSWDTTDGCKCTRQQHSFTIKKKKRRDNLDTKTSRILWARLCRVYRSMQLIRYVLKLIIHATSRKTHEKLLFLCEAHCDVCHKWTD